MILIIAEKPSLGRDIADALPGQKNGSDRRFIRKGDYVITWVFGHMLTLKEPEDYDEKYKRWSEEQLPIYFPEWGQKIGSDSGGFESKAERVKLIGELLEKSDSVIHAGDPDEEGQLLIDELLRWFKYSKPVKRLDTGDTTRGGLQKALSKMKDNQDCVNEGWSAYARSVADLMVGVNMSRFFTCNNTGVLLTVGRVQTPTLGLVVARDMQIEGHTKTVYYDIYIELDVNTPDGIKRVRAKYQPKKKSKNDQPEQITDKAEAERIMNSLLGKSYTALVERKTVKEDPPLPFNLVKLQSYCSSHFGYNPKEVMDITQSLREKHKAITYNRSDCQYLSEEHFKEAPKTMARVIANIGFKPKELDMSIHSRCFNDKNITAHFAIIPTNNAVNLDKLTEREKNVYLAVCKYYMAQFLPKAEKEKSKLTADVNKDYQLTATSSRTIKPGWLAIFKDMKKDAPTVLSDIAPGSYSANAAEGAVEEKETKPPARYTKATLNEDMTRIAKYVSDPHIKKLLELKDKDKKGENGSIGTSATRSSIIDGLVKKGYLAEQGKKLISTELGRELYRILPDEIKKADMTAEWWSVQEDIRAGKAGCDVLTLSVLETIEKILKGKYPEIDQSIAGEHMIKRRNSRAGTKKEQIQVLGKCPICGGSVIEGTKGYGCINWRPPKSCKFVIWKKHKAGLYKKQNFTKTMVKKWLKGEAVTCKKLVTKDGREFEAEVTMKINPTGAYGPVEFELHFKEPPKPAAAAPPPGNLPPEELPPDFWD